MRTPVDFSGPLLKIERAEHHIETLTKIVRDHIQANQRAMRGNRRGTQPKRQAFLGSRLPRHTPTVLGDALHNMRAALDHAYCLLTEANGRSVDKYSKFPFTEKGTRKDLEGSYKGYAVKTGNVPSDDIIKFIFDVIQPFPGGSGADLINLHVLDIADKHMILLPTRQDTTVVKLETSRFIATDVTIVGANGLSNAISFSSDAKGTNNSIRLQICFGAGQPLEGKPMLSTLKELHVRTKATLESLKEAWDNGG